MTYMSQPVDHCKASMTLEHAEIIKYNTVQLLLLDLSAAEPVVMQL